MRIRFALGFVTLALLVGVNATTVFRPWRSGG